MALVSGPMLSLDARGKFGGALVFSNWKGRPTVRQLVKPSNPRSAAQYGQRAMISFLSPAWGALSAGNQATWDALAAQAVISGFNAFTKFNLDKWTQFTTPYKTPTSTGETNPVMGALTVTGGVGIINVSNVITTANNIWGMLIAVSATTGFTPAKDNIRDAVLYSASPVTRTLTNFEPGTYYVRTSGFTGDGQKTAFVAQQAVVVT